MRADLRLSRRSFLLAFLGPLLPQRLGPAGTRMTIATGWDWLFRWCGFTGPSLPVAA